MKNGSRKFLTTSQTSVEVPIKRYSRKQRASISLNQYNKSKLQRGETQRFVLKIYDAYCVKGKRVCTGPVTVAGGGRQSIYRRGSRTVWLNTINLNHSRVECRVLRKHQTSDFWCCTHSQMLPCINESGIFR